MHADIVNSTHLVQSNQQVAHREIRETFDGLSEHVKAGTARRYLRAGSGLRYTAGKPASPGY